VLNNKTPKRKKPQEMETQNIEWKESWRDEYLKWICGFANAQGGCLEIGRNDKGALVGLINAKRLLEELPNKIRSTMGIVADVSLFNENGLEYIVIDVVAHPNAISYRGKCYLRSGSTTQELTGFALDELILRKYGRTWDSAPVPRIKASDFYHDAFDIFRKKAVSSKRLMAEDVECNDGELLEALKLTEGDYLLKAAVLLFHQDPERWCLGSYVKIGYFESDADLRYQDEINGSLIGIADRIIDTIYTKYFKGMIRYEGLQRIDEFPMLRDVLREAVLNAVVHKDYSTGNPIHIKIYDDKVIIYNDCQIPPNIEPESLLTGVRSNPHNPLIANGFFRSGQIEAWGRGIEKMKNGCIADGLPEPEFTILPNVFSICFHIRNNYKMANNYEITSDNQGDYFGINFGLNETQCKIVDLMITNPEITAEQIAESIGITKRQIEANISKLKASGIVERIGARKKGRWVVKQGKMGS
jgi:ATP-dependent DNA helicase RecG